MTQKSSWLTPPQQGEFPVQLTELMAYVSLSGLVVSDLKRCKESADYGAYEFCLAGQKVAFRVAKLTPTKIGQFVTLWKRPNEGGEIEPFSDLDGVDWVVICVFDDSNESTQKGVFLFDAAILLKKGIFTQTPKQGERVKEGKRGFRLYPPWTTPVAKQAMLTQHWQLDYFVSCEIGCEKMLLTRLKT